MKKQLGYIKENFDFWLYTKKEIRWRCLWESIFGL